MTQKQKATINKKARPNKRPNVSKNRYFDILKSKKSILVIFFVIFASIGSYLAFFTQAASSNCQSDGSVPICDVDQTLLSANGIFDTVLSVDAEAKNLSSRGVYYGPAFRAPTKALNGAVPVYRIYNEKATYHDWVTDSQKAAKEAKYDGLTVQGTPFYVWKTNVPGTVPVYRLTRAEAITQSVFSVDKAWVDKMLAQGANDPNGWKRDVFGPFIAFYAYHPAYSVPGTTNPGNCADPANLSNKECETQLQSLKNATQTPTTTPTSAPNPTTSTAKPAPTIQPTIITPTAASNTTVSKPISPSPTPPPADVTNYDSCPTAPSMDAGLAAYIDGVNNKKLNYSPNCHTWYLTYAQKKNNAAIGAFVNGLIEGCIREGGQWKGDKCDTSLRDYLKYAQLQSNNCLSINQAYDAPNNRCVPLPQNTSKYRWTCNLSGEMRVSVPKVGYEWPTRPLKLPVYATSQEFANNLCIKWRSGLNKQDIYRNYKNYGTTKDS